MALTENTINRLYNWKFTQALNSLEGDAHVIPHESQGIKALSDAFGNCGWFSGTMARIIQMAVHDLIGDVDD